MTADDAYLLLTQFFQERQAPRRALAALREGVEIGIEIGPRQSPAVECAVFRRGPNVLVERRRANKPDFIFSLAPETVSVLANDTQDDVGEIGLGIFKEMLTGSVAARMPGGLLSVLRNGYLEVVATGGPKVAAFLAQTGLGSPTRVIDFLRNLGKR